MHEQLSLFSPLVMFMNCYDSTWVSQASVATHVPFIFHIPGLNLIYRGVLCSWWPFFLSSTDITTITMTMIVHNFAVCSLYCAQQSEWLSYDIPPSLRCSVPHDGDRMGEGVTDRRVWSALPVPRWKACRSLLRTSLTSCPHDNNNYNHPVLSIMLYLKHL